MFQHNVEKFSLVLELLCKVRKKVGERVIERSII